jgi:lipopolysaccharide/colanic/teichoic acid biosynthesis glycosyltransferase
VKKGPEFQGSHEKRMMDLAVANALRPASFLVGILAKRDAARRGEPAVSTYPRIGANGEVFDMPKFTTQAGDSNRPVDRLSNILLPASLDELAQMRLVRSGQMSAFGFRPLPPELYEEFMDTIDAKTADVYRRLVLPTKPGVFSSFAREFHEGNTAMHDHQFRAEADIRDVMDDSISYELQFLGDVATRGVFAMIRHQEGYESPNQNE